MTKEYNSGSQEKKSHSHTDPRQGHAVIIAVTGMDNLSHRDKSKGGAAPDRDGNFYVDTKWHCSLQSPQQEVSRNKETIYNLLIVPQFYLHASFSFCFFATMPTKTHSKDIFDLWTSIHYVLQQAVCDFSITEILEYVLRLKALP